MRTELALLALLLYFFPLGAINDNASTDAVALGLGGTSVASLNAYGAFNNQAVLALISQPTIACSYASPFGFSDAKLMAVLPFEYGTIGIGLSRFGTSLYNEMKLGVSYSRMFGDRFSASLQADVLSVLPSPSEDVKYAFTSEIGLWVLLLDDLTLGFHIYNFLNMEYAFSYYDEAIPVNTKLGLAYQIFSNFTVTTELENSSIYGTSVRGGMSYDILDNVVARVGAASNPALVSIGLGVKLSTFNLDMAVQSIRYVGRTASGSISYAF